MPDSPERRWRGSPRGWPVLQGMLPIERSRVPAEMLAGLTLAALGIPAVLGYAKIAGMPLVTGLYTMLLPMAAYAILGSSRHLVVAADSATAVILAAALTGLAVTGSERYVRLAGLAALLTGAMLFAARLARLSFLANFLSRTVLVGFLTGVGIQVAAGQLPDMLGVTAAGGQTLAKLVNTVRVLPHVQTERVPAGAVIIRQGDAADRFYVVTRGHVEVVNHHPRGDDITLAWLGPGEYFGEMGLLQGVPRTATVRAGAENVELLSLDRDAFDELIRSAPETGADIGAVMTARLAASA